MMHCQSPDIADAAARQVQRNQRSAAAAAIARPRRGKWTVRRILYVTASAVIAILVIAGFAAADFLNVGQAAAPTGRADEYREGVGIQHTIMPEYFAQNHVLEPERVEYSTTPPTSGRHWDRWTQCGWYPDGIDDELATHNLEHGNIVVSYNLASTDEEDELWAFLRDDLDGFSDWGLLRYYDKLEEGKVAAATWGVLEVMDGIDRERLTRFFNTYFGSLGPGDRILHPCALPDGHTAGPVGNACTWRGCTLR